MYLRSPLHCIQIETSKKEMSEQRKQLIKVVETLTTKRDAFVKAVESYEQCTKEIVWNLDRDIELKQEELDKLAKNYENQLTDGKIKLEHDLKMFEYETVLEVLKERKQIPCSETEIHDLKQQIADLKETSANELKKAVSIEKNSSENKLAVELERLTLKHNAETAKLNAEVGQRTSEISVLQNTVKNLQSELAAQRELTKDVALAGKQAPIQQSFGKNN
jgi:hypothetical protein